MAETEEKVVLVTGAALRIGACIARTFHRHGCRVIVHYNQSTQAATRLVDQLNRHRTGSAVCLQADLGDAAQMQQLAEQAYAQFNRLDCLINNASAFFATEFGRTTQAEWDQLIDSNLRGAFFLSQALATELRRQQGAIINIVDTHADKPLAGHAVYTIAKAGLKAMTKSLALELAPDIRVNGISPGAILWPAPLEDDSSSKVQIARQKILDQIPLGKLGEAQFIAEAAYFLACEASYITGQTLNVDGGRRLA